MGPAPWDLGKRNTEAWTSDETVLRGFREGMAVEKDHLTSFCEGMAVEKDVSPASEDSSHVMQIKQCRGGLNPAPALLELLSS